MGVSSLCNRSARLLHARLSAVCRKPTVAPLTCDTADSPALWNDSPMASTSQLGFDTLSLPPATLENLRRLGYLEMTAIQAASLPPALLGKDLIAQAKTGSGKTAAFALALLANLNTRRFAVHALVL